MDSRHEPHDEGPADHGDAAAAADARGVREPRSVTSRFASALGDAASAVGSAATAVGAAVESTVEATVRRFEERPGARVRRVRRLAHEPLPYLYDVHPDARRQTPRELGLRTIDAADVVGTAVGGGQQRGADFLPLKPFRSRNWVARWQRLGKAADRLAILPPIDVIKHDDTYWVLDGHNRVGMALYRGQAAIDADVTELTGSSRPSEPAESFASLAAESRELRAAVSRSTPGTKGIAGGTPDRTPDP